MAHRFSASRVRFVKTIRALQDAAAAIFQQFSGAHPEADMIPMDAEPVKTAIAALAEFMPMAPPRAITDLRRELSFRAASITTALQPDTSLDNAPYIEPGLPLINCGRARLPAMYKIKSHLGALPDSPVKTHVQEQLHQCGLAVSREILAQMQALGPVIQTIAQTIPDKQADALIDKCDRVISLASDQWPGAAPLAAAIDDLDGFISGLSDQSFNGLAPDTKPFFRGVLQWLGELAQVLDGPD